MDSNKATKFDNGANQTPWFVLPLLVAAVLAVSSAATVFDLMPDVPAICLAAWRLQLTSFLLGIGAAHQWLRLDSSDRQRTRASWRKLACSGLCLALHFGLWVWGLQHTSLTHSLLLVSCTPVLLAASSVLQRQPISRGEVGGSVLGFAGGMVLALGALGKSEQQSHVSGDVASLLAAFAIMGYLQIGGELRQWMPIFIYAFPVTGFAAFLLTLFSLMFEAVTLFGAGHEGIFGWLVSARYALPVAYLAVGPGLVGHTGFNTLLRYLTPLTVSLAVQLEPLIGSVIGWVFWVLEKPGLATYVGGAMVLGATALVTYASSIRQRHEQVDAGTSDSQNACELQRLVGEHSDA